MNLSSRIKSRNSARCTSRPATLVRSAFTLVELLIVLTVIGILVGLLLPAVNSAMISARELAIRTEMVQIEQGIESFKTEYGFYPPSFEQFNRGATAADQQQGRTQFLAYLNRVSPNHQESSTAFPGAPAGSTRLSVWWSQVGRFLDQSSSLTFWLSGLTTSKQYPLTGGADLPLPAYPASTYSDGTEFTIGGALTLPDGSPFEVERKKFIELNPSQLTYNTIPSGALGVTAYFAVGGLMNTNVDLEDISAPGSPELAVTAGYQQPHGPSNGDKLYRYRDADSYIPFVIHDDDGTADQRFPGYAYFNTGTGVGVNADPDVGQGSAPNKTLGKNRWSDATIVRAFYGACPNSTTFQLISAGMDGLPGLPVDDPTLPVTELGEDEKAELNDVSKLHPNFVKHGFDNMTNFAGGRLELYLIEEGLQ